MALPAERAAAIAIAPFVAMLLGLSAVSTIAAFGTLSTNVIVDAAESGYAVSPDDALSGARASRSASIWFEPARYRLRAARALLALPPADRRRAAREVETLTTDSLRAAPMSSYGWTLLAFLRLDRQQVKPAIDAWQMSLLLGRYVPNLMTSRLLLGMELQPYDRSVGEGVVDQVQVLAEVDPRELAELARKAGREPEVRALLKTDPAGAAAFERATAELVAGAPGRVAAGAADRGR